MLSYSDATLYFFFAYGGVVIAVGMRALSGKVKLPVTINSSGLVAHGSSTLLWCFGLLMLMPLLMGISIIPEQWSDLYRQSRHPSSIDIGFTLANCALFTILPALLIVALLYSLPVVQELTLDKNKRVYHLRSGTLRQPKIRSGSWDDIRGVYVRPVRAKGSTAAYGVYLAWEGGLSGGPPLGFAGQQEQAERIAAGIASDLGLRVVDRPDG